MGNTVIHVFFLSSSWKCIFCFFFYGMVMSSAYMCITFLVYLIPRDSKASFYAACFTLQKKPLQSIARKQCFLFYASTIFVLFFLANRKSCIAAISFCIWKHQLQEKTYTRTTLSACKEEWRIEIEEGGRVAQKREKLAIELQDKFRIANVWHGSRAKEKQLE